ncbi:transcriptional regulator [Cryobacterium sp. TMT1-66-1]|uniref:transcriptional regulator n=1 Tax=Cryobacterium sp. TMT1-66-1 TaxID=1259242 RepID=UPI00106D83CC|nr:transcriptional regulator [Cryobacterium sp. TMT1-66-1]TFD07005.1 transcriptional regulator [Cryobacterium sp. TMT1-66-1]
MPADPRFDEAIHALTRLRLCALLRPLDAASFSTLVDTLDLSEANLSKTIRNLTELGYVHTSKQTSPERADSRRTTSVSLTPRGRTAFDGHIAALRELASTEAL